VKARPKNHPSRRLLARPGEAFAHLAREMLNPMTMDTLATIVIVLGLSALSGLGLAWGTMAIIFHPMKRYSHAPAASPQGAEPESRHSA
jgi:hypothetical protein